MTEMPVYKKKDFVSDQEVRWCPGCGDYAILNAIQTTMTKIGRKKEDIVFISGIGCSSRFPYYMNTYGLHTIHGRAPAFASGLKTFNPNLSIWVVTGDGDGLSIGGNHLIHTIRRNFNLNILLFNNEIYGLTKGQYSPTSKPGTVTKSTPYGSLDRPFLPSKLALGAGSTFFARTMDTDPKHMGEIFLAAEAHQGCSFIEIMQNCVIFNDKIHDDYTNRKKRDDHVMFLKEKSPIIFGAEKNKGLIIKNSKAEFVEIGDKYSESDLVVHDSSNENQAYTLANLKPHHGPIPMGILYQNKEDCYDQQVNKQIEYITKEKGKKTVKDLLHSGNTWKVD